MDTRRRRATIANFVDQAFEALDQVDYYRVLGVASSCSESTIRDAYYKLAAKLHPDVHGSEIEPAYRARLTAVYSRVVEAYRVLSVPEKRQQYNHALAKGSLRLRTGAKTRPPAPEEEIQNANAKRFFQLGLAALGDNNPRSAVTNFKLALKVEPDSQVIQAKLAEAEKLAG